MTDIDATVELVGELERLAMTNAIARDAPRGRALYAFLADGMAGAPLPETDLRPSSRLSRV